MENMFDFSAKKTRESVEKSLELLGVGCIDVIQVQCYQLKYVSHLPIHVVVDSRHRIRSGLGHFAS